MTDRRPPGLGRRAFLLAAGAGTVGVAVGAGASAATDHRVAAAAGPAASAVPFWGSHQAGIATAAQDHLRFAAFDLVAADRPAVAALLQTWTEAAARLCTGAPVAAHDDASLVPPADTGEAAGAGPRRLTITFGFGAGLFERDGADRYGLRDRRPAALTALPAFAGDQLEAARSDGDLAVQVCADDPVVAFHALHDLNRLARGAATLRWIQAGFGRASSTVRTQDSPRNLMGSKDGTNNIDADNQADMDQHVWVGQEGPTWLNGGSYVVTRRIRMLLDPWDRSSLDEQERTIGRHKASGAPLGAVAEFDPVDLAALDSGGQPVIPADAHIRLAAAATNDGARILRRGYSFDDGVDALGEQAAGLFFVSYQRDPEAFVTIQRRLAGGDALNEYIRHTSSALFACPPGAQPGSWVGQALFEP